MSNKSKKFVDDSWAVWVTGEDTSTVYINNWMNPKGKSYVDFGIHIRNVQVGKHLFIYIPFAVEREEVEDLSLRFNDRTMLNAVFNTSGIIDYKKNEYTSEMAYNGHIVDLVHVSTLPYTIETLKGGSLFSVDLEELQSYIDNEEAYFLMRLPHKSLNGIFNNENQVETHIKKFHELIMSPVISYKYWYSVRVNESGLLPQELIKVGALHAQRLKKAVVTITIADNFELNDGNCFRIQRMEPAIEKVYAPQEFMTDDMLTYHWKQNRADYAQGRFNFFFNISGSSVSKASVVIYIILLLITGIIGNIVTDCITHLFW